MAYAFKVHRVSFIGTCSGGAESWVTGLFLGSESADPGTVSQAQVDLIAARWQTFFTNTNTGINPNWKTTEVKVAMLNTDGKTDPLNVVYHTYPSPIVGGYGGSPMPDQVSLAATMTSSLPRGLASKGRMFLPGNCSGIDGSTGKITSFNVGNIATQFQTLINGINTDGVPDAQVILASFGTTLPTVKAGVNKLVTGIKIGDVYDTQRRRRNNLVESYTSHTIP